MRSSVGGKIASAVAAKSTRGLSSKRQCAAVLPSGGLISRASTKVTERDSGWSRVPLARSLPGTGNRYLIELHFIPDCAFARADGNVTPSPGLWGA